MKKQSELKDRIFILSNGRSPLTFSIANKHTPSRPLLYTDTESRRQRALRYARNQDSVFVDEQNDFAIVEQIVFQDGKLIVSKNNFQLQKFLDMHPDNELNGGHVFYEYDSEKIAQQNMQALDAELEAMIAIKNMDFDKLKSLASLFLSGNIDKMQSSEIRHNMILIAREDPHEILQAIDNPDTEVDAIAKRAIDDGYVFVKGGKDLHYNLKTNKTKILTIKHGMTTKDALSQWLQSDAGLEFYELLRDKFSTEE